MLWDDWDAGDGEPDEHDRPNRECKACGKGGLHWEDTDQGWQLYDAKFRKHVCNERSRNAVTLADFDEVKE